jgi:hypothetical protein
MAARLSRMTASRRISYEARLGVVVVGLSLSASLSFPVS